MTSDHMPLPPDATLLVVGAGGFIGGFIVNRAIELGYKVWAGVRMSTSRRYLSDKRIKFVEFDYDDDIQIEEALKNNAPSSRGWDYIIWNLGATKCADFRQFKLINFYYPRSFVRVLLDIKMIPAKFLYMSSLSALGPVREVKDGKEYSPITDNDSPMPNTKYGLSKIQTETFLRTLPGFPWIIFRPTGVYGPHEKDYLMMIKSIDSHWDFSVGYKPQLLTFIYVDDLVNAIFKALPSEKAVNESYIISENRCYTQKDFRNIVKKALGRKFVIPVKMPLCLTFLASAVAEKFAAAQGRPSTLNRDKYKIMKQRNWNCDVSKALNDFGFEARVSLEEGVRRTVKAYLEDKNKGKKH